MRKPPNSGTPIFGKPRQIENIQEKFIMFHHWMNLWWSWLDFADSPWRCPGGQGCTNSRRIFVGTFLGLVILMCLISECWTSGLFV